MLTYFQSGALSDLNGFYDQCSRDQSTLFSCFVCVLSGVVLFPLTKTNYSETPVLLSLPSLVKSVFV